MGLVEVDRHATDGRRADGDLADVVAEIGGSDERVMHGADRVQCRVRSQGPARVRSQAAWFEVCSARQSGMEIPGAGVSWMTTTRLPAAASGRRRAAYPRSYAGPLPEKVEPTAPTEMRLVITTRLKLPCSNLPRPCPPTSSRPGSRPWCQRLCGIWAKAHRDAR